MTATKYMDVCVRSAFMETARSVTVSKFHKRVKLRSRLFDREYIPTILTVRDAVRKKKEVQQFIKEKRLRKPTKSCKPNKTTERGMPANPQHQYISYP